MKIPLSFALALSVLINVALLRRQPAPVPQPIVKVEVAKEDAPAAEPEVPRPRDTPRPADVVKPETTISNLSLHDARAFNQLWVLFESLIEVKDAEGEDDYRRPFAFRKKVLSFHRREESIRALADFLLLDTDDHATFLKRAGIALHFYHRLQQDNFHDYSETWKICERLKQEGKFEEVKSRARHLSERVQTRHALWVDTDLQPVRSFLEAREGVRPALLNRHLVDFLTYLGSPEQE